MQSCPWGEMKKERAARVFGEFKLDPRVESVQMDANHACGPETALRGERSLIECGEPAVRQGHLVVRAERSWFRFWILRRNETGGTSVNGRKVHDSSVVLQDVRPLRTYYRGWVIAVMGKVCRILCVEHRRTSEVNDEGARVAALRTRNWRIWRKNIFSRTGFPQDLHGASTSFPQAHASHATKMARHHRQPRRQREGETRCEQN